MKRALSTTGANFLAILAMLLFSFELDASQQSWKWIGPPAGSISPIVPDRNSPKIWFAVNSEVPNSSSTHSAR